MKFGFIMTVDTMREDWFGPASASVEQYNPHRVIHRRGAVHRTESHASEIEGSCGWHHKWVGLVTKDELKELARFWSLSAHSMCDTMGALGMPGGLWYGCSPAWSFDGEDGVSWVNVYITPWPEVIHKTGVVDSEKNWNRMKRALHTFIDRA